VPVVSSTYESGFGLCALAQVAAAIQPPDAHAGLDTYEWLDADILRVRPPLRRPVLALSELEPFAASFDEARLQKL
jgi:O-succinylbenzoate synthase